MNLYLDGVIGENVFYRNIVEEYNKNKEDKDITLYIHSPGGCVYEGFAIYDFLSQVPQDIKVVVEGMCASMATVIMTLGKERVMRKNATFMIHLPSIFNDRPISYTADELDTMSLELRKKEDRIKSIYKKVTSISEEDLQKYMKDETFMTAEEALKLGFITSIEEPLKAVAFLNNKFNTNKTNAMEKELSGLNKMLDKIWNFLSGEQTVVAELKVTTDDGKEIQIDTNESSYKVGDVVNIEDGEYKIPATKEILVVADKKIMEIKKMEEEVIVEENVDSQLKLENEELKNRIDDLEIKMIKYNELFEQISGKIDKINKSITSKYAPEQRKTQFTARDTEKVTSQSDELKKMIALSKTQPVVKNFKQIK